MVPYDVYSDFDIHKHKQTFRDYLEVIIDADGHIMYAVPSHQEKLIAMVMEHQGWTRQQLMDNCPRRYYFAFLEWLLLMADAVSVWSGFCLAPAPNSKHIAALCSLHEAGIYTGAITQEAKSRPTTDELMNPGLEERPCLHF